MVRHNGIRAREPVIRHAGQDAAFFGNRRGQNNVKSRQAIRRHDQQVFVVNLINVAHLALAQALQGRQVRLEKRGHFSFNSFFRTGRASDRRHRISKQGGFVEGGG